MFNLISRAKDIKSGKWVTGDLTHNQKVTATVLTPRTMVGGYEVDPQTVGHFSGIMDSKGQKIFDGDILEVTLSDMSSINKLVRFIPEMAAFCLANNYDLQYKGKWQIWHHFDQEWIKETSAVVIGNYYDNPDLL